MNQESKTAIVTGAARGIGQAIAAQLATDGFRIAVVDQDADECKATTARLVESGATAVAVPADVSDEGAVEAAVAEIERELGPPTVLVNNAGVTRDNLLFKMSLDDWDMVMQVHLRGSFLFSRAAQRHMVDAGWGRIVNISSVSALGNPGQANYAAAKAGLQGLTKTLAMELGRFGITVNAIAPGFIVTDMTHATARRMGVDWETFVSSGIKQIPMGRVGTPEDVAHMASFLVQEGSSFVSGQVIYVAGGPKC